MGCPDDIELTVILPAYNEGQAVAEAVACYCTCLPVFCPAYELLVIDDASTDDTLRVAQAAAQGWPRVRVLHNPTNLGQVGSLRRGFIEARGQFVTHNGLDLPFEPQETHRLLEELRRGADLVVVQRTNRRAYGLVRKVVSWCNICLVQALFRSPFTDHNFVQGFRRRLLEILPVESAGVSTVTTELILKALTIGARVRSLHAPYHHRRAGRSSVTFRKVVRTTLELLRLWPIMRRWTPQTGKGVRDFSLPVKSWPTYPWSIQKDF
jgi:glycosyltransferase involved in cell wall biosynthesis